MKTTLRLAAMLLILSFGNLWRTHAQTLDIQIGTGTATNQNMPVNYLWNFSYTQQIITQAELQAQGVTSGLITKIRYYWSAGPSSSTWNNWTMFMGNTSQAVFSSTTNWITVGNMSQVFSGIITTPAGVGNWFEVELQSPFMYTGGNLVIAVDENQTSYDSSNSWGSYTASTNRGIHYRSDGTNPDPANPPTATGTLAIVPRVQMVVLPINLVMPTSLTQGAPSCATGVPLTAVGTPEPNSVWYWQTSATGTSTANNAANPFSAMTNGTYYLRYHYPSANYWGPVQSITVSSLPVEATPPSPIAAQNPSCTNTNGTMLSMTTATAPIQYFWQGQDANSISQANPATSTFPATVEGNYYVRAYNSTTQCWSEPSSINIMIDDLVPPSTTVAQTFFPNCVGAPSIEITAETSSILPGTLSTPMIAGNNCGGGSMFKLQTTNSIVTINGFDVSPVNAGAQTLKVHYKPTTWEGSETNPAAWTLLGTYTFTGVANQVTFVPVADIVLAPGVSYGFYLEYNNYYTTISAPIVYSNADLVLTTGAGLCSSFGGVNMNRAVNTKIYYTAGLPTTATWYDAPTGGTMLSGNSTLETVGTSVLPNSAVSGTYNFYVASTMGGCQSDERVLVQVALGDVHTDFATIGVQCHNGENGTAYTTTVHCGTPPFQYSVNGGAFGTQPMNLGPGINQIQLKDANNLLSAIYPIQIANAPVPTDIVFNYIYDTTVSISWTATGMEQYWIVEWGLPGFVPGTGNHLGTDTVQVTNHIINGLLGDTDYEVYVSATCSSSTPGDWTSAEFLTDCNAMPALGYCESFEDPSTLHCWTILDLNNDNDMWVRTTSYGNTGTSSMVIYTDYNAGNNNDYLIMPRMLLTGNEVLSFAYRAQSSSEPNDLKVMISTTGLNPSDFTQVLNLPSIGNTVFQDTTIDISAYSGSAYIAFVVLPGGLDGWNIYIDDVCIDLCNPIPAQDGSTTICSTDGSVDLLTVVNSEYSHGTWDLGILQSTMNGSVMNVQYLTSGTYTGEYVVTAACSSDTSYATINIVTPLNAGESGLITVCKNQLINLYGGLSGNADFGGIWYNPSNQPVNPYFQTGTLLGQQVYKYIVTDPYCGTDTSEVIVNILNCDYLSLEEMELMEALEIVPNPTSGKFQIAGVLGGDLRFQIIDISGRTVQSVQPLNYSTSFVDLSKVESGVYLIQVMGHNSTKMLRVVKE